MAIKITQNTLIGAGQIVTIDNPVVDSFNYWLAPDRPGFLYEGSTMPTPQFLNAGTVTITLAAAPVLDPPGMLVGFAIARTSGTDSNSLFHNLESGIFRVISSLDIGASGSTKGFFAPQQTIAFHNDGLFEVRGLSFTTTGVETYNSSTRFTNTGIFRVEGAYFAEGAYINNGGMFRNGGLIDVAGGSGAVGVYFGSYVPGLFSDGQPAFVNDGTIRAVSSDEPSFGVYVAISLNGGTYINSGVIEADYAFWINPGAGYASTIRSSETLINNGEIRGDIGLAYGADILQNHGNIYGYTDLGEGNDVYEGASGFHYGLIAAGTGDDQITGGDGAEIIFGQEGRELDQRRRRRRFRRWRPRLGRARRRRRLRHALLSQFDRSGEHRPGRRLRERRDAAARHTARSCRWRPRPGRSAGGSRRRARRCARSTPAARRSVSL